MTDTAEVTPASPLPAPEIPDADDEAPSYLDLRPTGGIHLVVDGEKRRLRTPRMRDYRRLVLELWTESIETLQVRSHELDEVADRLTRLAKERADAGETEMLTPEERAEDRRVSTEIRQLTNDVTVAWWTETIHTLGVTEKDRQVDPDDLPRFLAETDTVNETINHWRTVPSRSGSR